ncbi:hypothetical protein CEW87_08775 [Parazoarcus communis]|uniref:TnsE C-terminal domain-containing protein n=1 Tax=Parazoarcus communis TaxID=41977 RepID=A0A2U8H1L1_9RHOO|nr:hypothetical protein [Parazoarcus communis]AWI79453.1 hypothetical protein CEW87_08775 [Parazoarcus communis]
MAIQLIQGLKKIRKVIRLASGLPDAGRQWVVWWYCGINKNHQAESQPSALVAFRELLSSGHLSDDVYHRRVPLTALGQVRVGTVWKEGLCQAEVILDTKEFAVDFTKGEWKLTSFWLAAENGELPPFPHGIYPLKYQKDQNWLLEFALATGGRLIVPCLEFFTRCYGRSAELRRVLATYPWSECKEKRLYAPLDEPEEPDRWKVKLRKRLVNGDVVLLAHAKYELYTERAVKAIYAQIEAHYESASPKPAFIKVAPWFRGPASIKAKGIWFDDGKSFLALQVVGCSDPSGVPILRGRENSNNAKERTENDEPGSAWAGMPTRVLAKLPEIVDLTDEVEPDPSAISMEIEDPEFEVLGQPRVVVEMKKNRAHSSSGQKVKGTDASQFSSGEPYGRGQGVGYASIHARPVMESEGMLRDMWNAMLFMKRAYPKRVTSVAFFTVNDGYKETPEPTLIPFAPFAEKDDVKPDVRNWPYIRLGSSPDVRGVLVARMTIDGRQIHIMEIQRRPQKRKDSQGNTQEAEESFQGLVFEVTNHVNIDAWADFLLTEVRGVKGVVGKLLRKCPGPAETFRHLPAKTEEMPCEAALKSALTKVGVNL